MIVGGPCQGAPDAEIRVTDDGGLTWRAATIDNAGTFFRLGRLESVCVTGSGTGLSIEGRTFFDDLGQTVLVTADGGESWRQVGDKLAPFSWVAGACGDENDLWVLGDDSRLARSVDGGVTWIDLSARVPPGLRLTAGAFHGTSGWLAAWDARARRMLVLQATNGGSFEIRHVLAEEVTILEAPPPLALGSLADGTLFAVGTDPPGFELIDGVRPVSASTRDEGATWTTGRFPAPGPYVSAISVVP